jgi:hypothetical protein
MSIFIWTHNSRKRSSACLWKESHALWTHLEVKSGQALEKKVRLGQFLRTQLRIFIYFVNNQIIAVK